MPRSLNDLKLRHRRINDIWKLRDDMFFCLGFGFEFKENSIFCLMHVSEVNHDHRKRVRHVDLESWISRNSLIKVERLLHCYLILRYQTFYSWALNLSEDSLKQLSVKVNKLRMALREVAQTCLAQHLRNVKLVVFCLINQQLISIEF